MAAVSAGALEGKDRLVEEAILSGLLRYPGETGPAAGMSATHAQEAARAWSAGELQGWRERGRMSRGSDPSLGDRERCGAGNPLTGRFQQ